MVADRAALAVARRQHGVLTVSQLQAAGYTRGALRQRVRQGWLRRVHRGVYLVGPVAPPLAPPMAATLACGERALLSHYPAAVLWGVRAGLAGGMHVTVVGRHVEGPPGVTVHRVRELAPGDATRRDGIPVTSLARTLLDLATQATPTQLARAVDEARVHHRLTDHALDEQFARYPRHRGVTTLREATATRPGLIRSEAEHRLLELIRAARLPEPETNVRVAGHEVDFFWAQHGLAVEVDGYAFHAGRAAFERDRRRDADLYAHGVDVLRVTWTRIADEPEALIALLARATASAAAARGAPSLRGRSRHAG